jgi:putative ABC transport system permease protein
MRWLSQLRLRVRSLFRKRQADRELSDELQFHLDGRADELVAEGMTPEQARLVARRELGMLASIEEECRDARGVSYIEQMIRDARYGLRSLTRSPGFATMAIVTLALGIGANTAIFSAVDAVLLRPLPYPAADELVIVWEDATSWGFPRNTPSPANYLDWKEQNRVFADMAAMRYAGANLTGNGDPEAVTGRLVTPNLFSMLGVQAAIGRTFAPDEERSGAKVVVLTHGLWRRRYGADPTIVGRTIQMNGEPYAVVGVMPASFAFPDRDAMFFWPLDLTPMRDMRGSHFLTVAARLAPGVTVNRARSDMDRVAKTIAAAHPGQSDANLGAVVVPLREQIAGDARTSLIVLFAAAGCVLLIACANLANLLLARAGTRQREIAVRKALGASPMRLVRQLVTESALLAVIGGAAGIALGHLGTRLLKDLVPSGLPVSSLTIDLRVLLFTGAITFATVLLFGAVPAFASVRVDVNDSLKRESRGAVAGLARRTRHALIIAEVTLATVLLIGAGLMIQTLHNMRAEDIGVRPDHLLTLRIALPPARYADQNARAAFYNQVIERVGALPGVRSAAFAGNLPLTTMGNSTSFAIDGRPDPPSGVVQDTLYRPVTRDYFATIGATRIDGRDFGADDRPDSPPVAIINEHFARAYWGTRSPVGDGIRLSGSNGRRYTIVGVVKDIRERGIDAPMKAATYVMVEQANANPGAFLAVRTETDPLSLARAVTTAVWSVDPHQPVSLVRSMDDIVDEVLTNRNLNMTLLSVFAGLALLLASLGIYGVLSYVVTERTREIGLRMALGASAGGVATSFVRQGLVLTAIGVAAGLVAALAGARTMGTMLYGVASTDMRIYLGCIALLSSVAAGACYLPARRAARVDPIVALREE